MRVNPNLTADLLSALSQAKQQEQTDLLQLSSGRRVNSPSDDPTAAAILVQNQSQSSAVDQYLRSADTIQGQLQSADSALSSVVTILQRAISLGVQGANGTLSDGDRNALVGEVQGIQSQLISLGNLSYQGQYVFGGTATQTAPFVADDSQSSGVGYQGNSNSNSVAVGDGYQLQMNIPGAQIFMNPSGNVFQSIQDLIVSLQSNVGVDSAVTGVRAAFDNVSTQRVFYGNAMNQSQSQQTYLNSAKLQLAKQEQSLAGADLAETVTSLMNAQNAQQAAMEAASRIAQTNLFDYLK